MSVKSIGVITSGGDAPGMNACVATIAAHAERHGIQARGIIGGLKGLLDAVSIPIGAEIAGLSRRGGSFLGTSRNDGFEEQVLRVGVAAVLSHCCIEALVLIGGDGSLKAASRLAAEGAPIVGVPCSIDNDIPGTEYSLGFDSAVNRALRVVDEIMDTAESLPERIFILETLGGKTGHLAVATAYAACADAVMIHEVPADVDAIALRIGAKMDGGGSHGLIVMCEGLGRDQVLARVEEVAGRRTRLTVIGHAQRGGSPTYTDRAIARGFAEKALEMVISDEFGMMAAIVDGDVGSVSLASVGEQNRPIDTARLEAVNGSFCPGKPE